MSETTIPDEFASIVRSHLRLIDADAELEPDMDIAAAGLDSVGMVSLVVELEEKFGVTLPDEELSWMTFQTPAALWNVISRLTQG